MTTQQDNTQVTNPETLVHEVPTHLESEEKLFLGLSMMSSLLLAAFGGFGYMVFTFLTIEPFYVKAAVVGVPTAIGAALSIFKIGDRPIIMMVFDALLLRFRSGAIQGSLDELFEEDMSATSQEATDEDVDTTPKVPISQRIRRVYELSVPMVYIGIYRFVLGALNFIRGAKRGRRV